MRFLKVILTILQSTLFFALVFGQQPKDATKALKTQKTIISGLITQANQANVKLRFYSDFISLGEEIFEVPLKADQSFKMSFNLSEAIPVYFQYEDTEIPIFIEPGDSLSLQLDAKDIENSLTFNGQGSIHNKCLYDLAKAFKKWDSDYILYEIAQNEARAFRRFMDGLHFQKHNYLDNYDPELRKWFSADFLQYIYAEVNYWWAFHLLNYRIEHPIANGDPSPMKLPKSYYNFLNTILISNDKALNNRHYLNFLDQYLQFRSEQGAEFPNKQLIPDRKVIVPSLVILESPDNPPVLEELKEGTRLKYLNEKSTFTSKTLVNDEFKEDYWYKVKTAIGTEGWVIGVGIEPVVLDTTTITKNEDDDHFIHAEKYLVGDVLLYTKASNLYLKKLYGATIDDMRSSVTSFISTCPIDQYNQLLKDIYKINNDNAVAYRLVSQPLISQDESEAKITIVVNEVKIDDPVTKEEPVKKPTAPIKEVKTTKYTAPVINNSAKSSYVEIDDKPSNRPSTTTIVKGKVNLHSGKKLKLTIYTDPIQFQEAVYDLNLQSGNQFEQAVEISDPTIGRLSYGNKSVDVYLEPGDKIELQINSQDFPKNVVFSGKGSVHNNYLKAQSVFSKSIFKELKKQIEVADETSFLSFMQKSWEERLKFYKEYRQLDQFSRGFQLYAKADMDYWYAFNLLNYPWEHPLYHDQSSPMKVSKKYYGFLEHIPISQADVLPNMNYTYFLRQYFDYLKMDPIHTGVEDIKLAERFLDGESLYYYKAKLYAIACRRGKAKEVGPAIQNFIDDCPYESFNDVLRLVYNEEKGLIEGAAAPDFSLADIDGNVMTLEDFKGKVVYLDFWATWCSPCLTKINNSKQLKNKFKDKDVVFVYVSLDKDKNAWKNYVKSHNIEGVHLGTKTANVYQSRIAKLYKVKRLPTYLLIDKAGNIAYNPAERKYGGRIEDQINLLLYSN